VYVHVKGHVIICSCSSNSETEFDYGAIIGGGGICGGSLRVREGEVW
jgi:hypothetical protein